MSNTPSAFRVQHHAETPVISDTSTQENPPAQEIPSVGPGSTESFKNVGEACIPDSQGRYGSSEGSSIEQQIEYAYQLETKPDVALQVIKVLVIPEIEQRVSGIVVPIMFEQACSRSGTRRRLAAGGFSPFPPDQIMNGEFSM